MAARGVYYEDDPSAEGLGAPGGDNGRPLVYSDQYFELDATGLETEAVDAQQRPQLPLPPAPAPLPNHPPAFHASGAGTPLLNPTRHLPLRADPPRALDDGSQGHAQVLTLDVSATRASIETARLKSHYFAISGYFFAALGTAMHIVVFLCFALAGSVTMGGLYVVTLLLEATAAAAILLRGTRGGLRWLQLATLICWTFIGVVLTLATTAAITNWLHFEAAWARWLAVGLTYAHVLICFGLAVSIANVMQAKLTINLRALQVQAAHRQQAGPDSDRFEKKGT